MSAHVQQRGMLGRMWGQIGWQRNWRRREGKGEGEKGRERERREGRGRQRDGEVKEESWCEGNRERKVRWVGKGTEEVGVRENGQRERSVE
jgi:hypothetical protein